MRKVIIALPLITIGCGEPAWKATLRQQCASWTRRAQNKSDSLNVEMNCASIYASNEARDEAQSAAVLSASAAASSAAASASSSVRR